MSKRTSIMWRQVILDTFGVRKSRRDYHKWLVEVHKNFRHRDIQENAVQKYFKQRYGGR